MTVQDLGAIGEFIGGIGVVMTLVYLAVQIRQNTKTVRASTYQAILDSARSDTELILTHPHLERVYRVGRRNFEELTEEERPLFRMLVAQLLLSSESLFLQHQQGAIDGDFWQRRQLTLRGVLSQPGVRQWWAARGTPREYYDPGFRELVESILREVGPEKSAAPSKQS
jgi:hypothetical protein